MRTAIKIDMNDMFRNLLCSAFEGGSNYWYSIVGHRFPPGVSVDDFHEGGRLTNPKEYWHPEELIPLHPGCTTLITADGEPKRWRLNRTALERGWEIMREKYPHDYADAMTQDGDMNTGDVFLQCCLFGELVYG